jgi:hypothetical protein
VGLGRSLFVGGKIMSYPGSAYIKAICRALECKPQAVYIIDCPLCPEDEQGQMELNPQSKTYWCAACGRDGTLQSLLGVAEGLFALRHRESLELMTTRPRVERGGTRR